MTTEGLKSPGCGSFASPSCMQKVAVVDCIIKTLYAYFDVWQVFAGPDGKGWVFVMEHLDIKGLVKYQATLGEQLARQVTSNL